MHPFPSIIDNSMRAEFVSCPQAFRRRYIEGWSRTGRSIHLHFGGAFAEGLAAYRIAFYGEGKSLDDSLAAGMAAIVTAWGDYEPRDDETKTLERCLGALESTIAQYPPITDHVQPLVEAGRHLDLLIHSHRLPITALSSILLPWIPALHSPILMCTLLSTSSTSPIIYGKHRSPRNSLWTL